MNELILLIPILLPVIAGVLAGFLPSLRDGACDKRRGGHWRCAATGDTV